MARKHRKQSRAQKPGAPRKLIGECEWQDAPVQPKQPQTWPRPMPRPAPSPTAVLQAQRRTAREALEHDRQLCTACGERYALNTEGKSVCCRQLLKLGTDSSQRVLREELWKTKIAMMAAWYGRGVGR